MIDWIRDPEAAAILARLGLSPPPKRMRRCEDLTTFYAETFCGEEVKRLRALRERHLADLLRLGDRTGDYAAFGAGCDMTVEKAIQQAIVEASRKAAA